MKLIVHIGPHKTGTTALQNFLFTNRERLRDAGIFYPQTIPGRTGHHDLAWAVKGWNLRLLGSATDVASAASIFSTFVRDTISSGSHTLLVSSEDFSLLSFPQWREFFSLIETSFSTFGVDGEITLTWSTRSIRELAASSYSTLVFFGLAKPFRSVRKPLQRHFRHFYARMSRWPSDSPLPMSTIIVPWSRTGFVNRWLSTELPSVDVSEMIFDGQPANPREPSKILRILAADNASRGIEFDDGDLLSWARFHDEKSIAIQREARNRIIATHR